MTKDQIISELKLIAKINKPIYKLILYGSMARGDEHPNSNYDLLVLCNKTISVRDEDSIYAPFYNLELKSGVLINPLIISKTDWRNKISPFKENVKKEGIVL